MSWEWEDYSERIYRRCFKKHGAILEPKPVLILFAIHHVLGLFVIPMNLYYYDEYYYWMLIALNSFSGFVSDATTEYSYYLDTDKYSGLCKMRVINFCATIFLIW